MLKDVITKDFLGSDWLKTVKKCTAVQIIFDCGAPIVTPQCKNSYTAVHFSPFLSGLFFQYMARTKLTFLLRKVREKIINLNYMTKITLLLIGLFCNKYPNSKKCKGFGIYEFYGPGEIVEHTRFADNGEIITD